MHHTLLHSPRTSVYCRLDVPLAVQRGGQDAEHLKVALGAATLPHAGGRVAILPPSTTDEEYDDMDNAGADGEDGEPKPLGHEQLLAKACFLYSLVASYQVGCTASSVAQVRSPLVLPIKEQDDSRSAGNGSSRPSFMNHICRASAV